MSMLSAVVSPDDVGEKRKSRINADENEENRKKQNVNRSEIKYEMSRSVLTESVEPISLCASHPEMFLERLQGNIELVYCDDGLKEGFIDTFNKAYFHVDKSKPDAVKKYQELKAKTGIFVAVCRRLNRETNQPHLKEGTNGGMFKQTYFVRHAKWSSDDLETDHRTCLQTIADVSIKLDTGRSTM